MAGECISCCHSGAGRSRAFLGRNEDPLFHQRECSPARTLKRYVHEQEHLRAHEGPIYLRVTDVVMPEMNGRDLVEQVNR
jgi:hypothetical protein